MIREGRYNPEVSRQRLNSRTRAFLRGFLRDRPIWTGLPNSRKSERLSFFVFNYSGLQRYAS
jgi:hypothetical protein